MDHFSRVWGRKWETSLRLQPAPTFWVSLNMAQVTSVISFWGDWSWVQQYGKQSNLLECVFPWSIQKWKKIRVCPKWILYSREHHILFPVSSLKILHGFIVVILLAMGFTTFPSFFEGVISPIYWGPKAPSCFMVHSGERSTLKSFFPGWSYPVFFQIITQKSIMPFPWKKWYISPIFTIKESTIHVSKYAIFPWIPWVMHGKCLRVLEQITPTIVPLFVEIFPTPRPGKQLEGQHQSPSRQRRGSERSWKFDVHQNLWKIHVWGISYP